MVNEHMSWEMLQEAPVPVAQWVAAFNAHDVAAIVSLYHEDASLFDPGMKRGRQGRTEIQRWFEQRFQTMPSIAYTPTGKIMSGGQHVVLPWIASGRGPRLLGQKWLARPFSVNGLSVFHIRDGLIASQRGYYDHLTVVEQILPPLKWLLPVRL